MALVIESGIPLPASLYQSGAHKPKGDARVAVESLEVGQSVLIEKKSVASSTAQVVAKKTGRKFATRSVEGGQRVWRLA
jgi:hypothetical protein